MLRPWAVPLSARQNSATCPGATVRHLKWRPATSAAAALQAPDSNASSTSGWAWQWWDSIGAPKWVCSPMVDQSERAFRLLTRRYGVGLAYTPMIHAEPFAAEESFRRTFFDAWEPAMLGEPIDADKPLIAQLGGDDPLTLLKAARILEPYVDAIDINFGCPTEDARKGGHNSHSPRCRRYGAYLLPDVPLVARIVNTLASGLRRVPVTAKIRLLDTTAETLEVAHAIEQAGAVALCVHGRTAKQRPKYAEREAGGSSACAPSWERIAAVRRAVGIPVIANGGVETRDDALRCLEETGAAAVMSAEALLEDPDLFAERQSGETEVQRMIRLAREFLDLAERYPSPLEYPPTKSHLFKMLHKLIGADQALARQKADAGAQLTLMEEMKLVLMRCPVTDFGAIRAAVDEIEVRYSVEPPPSLGPSWYRRWRTAENATPMKVTAGPRAPRGPRSPRSPGLRR